MAFGRHLAPGVTLVLARCGGADQDAPVTVMFVLLWSALAQEPSPDVEGPPPPPSPAPFEGPPPPPVRPGPFAPRWAPPAPAQKVRNRDWQHAFSLAITGKWGASAAHFWNIPNLGTAPGVGIRARYRLRFLPHWRFTGDLTGSIGGADDGTGFLAIGGNYRGTVGLSRRWFDVGWASMWTEAHKGFESLFYIPVPIFGFGQELNLYPVRQPWFNWIVTATLDTDLYVIAPSVTVSLSTAALLQAWGGFVGLEALVEGQVIVAAITNAASASAQVRLVSGYAF